MQSNPTEEKYDVDQNAPTWNDENDSLPDDKQDQKKLNLEQDIAKSLRYWQPSEHLQYLNGLYKFGNK